MQCVLTRERESMCLCVLGEQPSHHHQQPSALHSQSVCEVGVLLLRQCLCVCAHMPTWQGEALLSRLCQQLGAQSRQALSLSLGLACGCGCVCVGGGDARRCVGMSRGEQG